jgi:flagellar L-ring protein precursor FlgH
MKLEWMIAAALIIVQAVPAQADSLYRRGSYQALTSDLRMRHVGDLLTVMVYENASASSAADTTTARAANVGVQLRADNHAHSGSVATQNELDGRGHTQREGRVLAQLTVVIKEILPSGDLVVAGEQLLEINNESQRISVEGRVRPQDVSDTNVVLSNRIANARIRYSGQGDLSDRQRPAWWQRFLTLFGV